MDERLKQLLLLGREHYAKREFDKAESLLRDALHHADRFADVHDMLGVIAHHRNDFVLAERHFERALALNPHYTEAALKDVSGHVVTLAKAEDLPAHGEAVRRRFER